MSTTTPQRRSALPRFAEIAVERARLSVVPRARRPARRAPRVPFVTLVSLILLAGVVGLLLFNTSMQQASFTASQLEDQAADLSAREQALVMELDGLRDPERLAEAACKAGMVVAQKPAFLDVRTGKVTGTPTPAVKAPCGTQEPPPPPPTSGTGLPAGQDPVGGAADAGGDAGGGTAPADGGRGSGASHAQRLGGGR